MNEILEKILARQTYKESAFIPSAVNKRSGAAGLTQFMPNTWNDYRKFANNPNADPYNPEEAVKAQRWYMGWLDNHPRLSNFSNPTTKAAAVLAAYNWGIGNFDKKMKELSSKGIDISVTENWLPYIPAETRDYINTILFKKSPKFEENFMMAMNTSPIAKYYRNIDQELVAENKTSPAVQHTTQHTTQETPTNSNTAIDEVLAEVSNDPTTYNYSSVIRGLNSELNFDDVVQSRTLSDRSEPSSTFFTAHFLKLGGILPNKFFKKK